MRTVKIEPSYCPKNHYCPILSACPAGAITQESPFTAPKIDQTKCTNCGRCTHICAYGAFQMS